MVEQRFSPEDEQTIQQLSVRAAKLKDYQPSQSTAVALAFLIEGRERLLKASSSTNEMGGVLTAPDPKTFISSLHQPFRSRVIEGLYFVIFGSFARSYEEAKRPHEKKAGPRGWDDNEYIPKVNLHTQGTPMPQISAEIKKTVSSSTTPKQDTDNILALNINSTEEALVYLSANPIRLPVIVRAHLKQIREITGEDYFRKVVQIFRETSRRLSLPDLLAENQLRPGEKPTTLAPTIEDFLKEVLSRQS